MLFGARKEAFLILRGIWGSRKVIVPLLRLRSVALDRIGTVLQVPNRTPLVQLARGLRSNCWVRAMFRIVESERWMAGRENKRPGSLRPYLTPLSESADAASVAAVGLWLNCANIRQGEWGYERVAVGGFSLPWVRKAACYWCRCSNVCFAS